MKKLTLIICLTLVSGFAFSQWVQLNPELPIPQYTLTSVFFTDSNTGYIAGNEAIFKTIDGGETWNESFDGGFNSIFFADSITGYAVKAGTIIKTIDGGASWETLYSGKTDFNSL